MMKNPIFQLWESNTDLISTQNKCKIMFALIYFYNGVFYIKNRNRSQYLQMIYMIGNNISEQITIFTIWEHAFTCLSKKMKNFKILYTKCMENCEAMSSSTHSSAYLYWLFKKCFIENYENKKFHIFLIFYPIYIKFSLFYSKCFTLSIELT